MRPPESPVAAARDAAVPQTGTVPAPTVAPAEKSAAETSSADSFLIARPNDAPRREPAQQADTADLREERLDTGSVALQRREAEPKLDASASPTPEGVREQQEVAPPPVGRAAAAAPESAAPAAAPVASAPAPAQTGRFSTPQEAMTSGARVIVASPGTAFRWRLGPAGSVEFSTDAGTAWESRPTGEDADLTAGASPGGTVCWVVGRGGTVLLTTDGRQWRRVTFPVAADLVAVQATDARTATVTAADGRRFRTVDGGGTWERL